MPRKRYKPEKIVVQLRQIDVLVSQGQSIADAIRQIGVSAVSTRRAAQWRDVVHAAGGPDRGHGGGNVYRASHSTGSAAPAMQC
jgi:hypothetical protein